MAKEKIFDDLDLVPGDDWKETIEVTDKDGAAVPLDSWTVVTALVEWDKDGGGSVTLTTDLTDAVNGNIKFTATEAETVNLPLGKLSEITLKMRSPAGIDETIYYAAVNGVKVATENTVKVTMRQPSAVTSRIFDTLADLLASTTVAQGVGTVWRAEGYIYVEVSSGGDIQNSAATPVPLDVLKINNTWLMLAFNPNADGVTDDSAKINSVNNSGDTVDLGGKTYEYDGTFAESAKFYNGIIIDDSKTHDFGISTLSSVPDTALTSLGAQADNRVRFTTTANVDLSGGGLANATTHDGVTAATGDWVLVRAQTDASENGIYVVPASGAVSRVAPYGVFDRIAGAVITVVSGNIFAKTQHQCVTGKGGTLGTTDLDFELAGIYNFNVGGTLRGFIDVRAFEAYGSGDETTELLSAIDSGENLWIPKGLVYSVTGNLTGFANGQKIHGLGTIKKLGTDQIPIILLDDELDDIEFKGFTIDGTAANFSGGNPVPGILGYVASNIRCHKMLFTDIADSGIKLRDCANLDAVGSRFLRCYQNGIEIRNYAADVRLGVTSVVSGTEYEITSVSGGTDWSSVGGGNPAAVGDVFTATASGSIASLGTARQQYTSTRPTLQGGHRVLRNRFKYVGMREDVGTGAVDGCCVIYQSADALRPLEDILIEGNVGQDVLRGFWAESNVLGRESRQVIIRSNMLRNNVDGKTSAFVEDLGYGKVGIGVIGVQNAVISGNPIKNFGNYLHAGSDTGGIVVSGNNNKNILIVGNPVIDTTADTDRTDYCIDIRTGGEGIVVKNNPVGGAAQGQINVASGINGVSVYNNPGAELDFSWPPALFQMEFKRDNVQANGNQSTYILVFNETEDIVEFDARLVAMRVILSTPITAGSATFKPYVNGTNVTELNIDETDLGGGVRKHAKIAIDETSDQVISAGQRVKVVITTDSGFAPTTLDARMILTFAKGS